MRLHFLSFNPAVLLLHFLQNFLVAQQQQRLFLQKEFQLYFKRKKIVARLVISLDLLDRENCLVFEKSKGIQIFSKNSFHLSIACIQP